MDKLEAEFVWITNGRQTITEAELLRVAFKGSRTRKPHRLKYLQACQLDRLKLGRFSPLAWQGNKHPKECDLASALMGVSILLAFVRENKGRLTKQ